MIGIASDHGGYELKQKVLELGADVGISFDGDGDRLGVVTKTGKFIPTDIFAIAEVHEPLLHKRKGCSKIPSHAIEI